MDPEDSCSNKNKIEGSIMNQPIGKSLDFAIEIVCE